MNKLAAMYNLSPEAAANLAKIQGVDPGGRAPGFVPHDDAVNLDDAEYSPNGDAQAQALQARGADSPNPFAYSNPSREPGWTPEKQTEREARAQTDAALAGADPQGPAAPQDFPTVRTQYADQGSLGAGAGGPVRVTPAHWQPGSHTVARQLGMNPDELQEGQYYRDIAAGKGLQAGDARLEAAQRGAQADALYAAAHTKASQDMRDKLAAIEAQRARYVDAEKAKLERLSVAAQKDINKDAYWNGKGELGRLGAAIAIGLGQFGAMMRGGPNNAWNIIQSGMQESVDVQKANIANAKAAYDVRSNLFARNLAEFGDRERAAVATKINYLDQVSGMVEAQRAVAKSADADAAALDLQKRIYDEKAKYADQFAELTHTKVNEQANEHFVPTQYSGGGGQTGKDALYVPTLGGYARDEKTAQTLNNKGAIRMQMGENMRKIHELLEEAKGLNSATSPLRLREIDAELKRHVADTLTKNTVLEGQGAMSAADKAVAEEAKGLQNLSVQFVPNSIISRKQERVKASAEGILEAHRLDGEANGIQLGREQYRQGPNGPVPVRVLEGRNKTVTKNTEGYDDVVQKPKGVVKK